MAEGSHGGRLLDAVEADPCGRRGDGRGPGHGHLEGVVVLPAVPPLSHGRAHLWERQRLSRACGGQSWDPESSPLPPAPRRALQGRWGALLTGTLTPRHWLVPKAGPPPEAPVGLGISALAPLPSSGLTRALWPHPSPGEAPSPHSSLGHPAFPAPSLCHLIAMVGPQQLLRSASRSPGASAKL